MRYPWNVCRTPAAAFYFVTAWWALNCVPSVAADADSPDTVQASTQSAGIHLEIDAVDESAGNLPCYKISTPTATYSLEKTGAGLSSLIDRDGRDWLSFHPAPGSGSRGEYRGFPNAVHQQLGNYFHPKNAATEPSQTQVDYVGSERVTISAVSSNEAWACRYDFFPTHCTFTMTRMPAGYKFWVLYEGTPGGTYDDDDWWMTSASAQKYSMLLNHEGDIPEPEWIAFGDPRVNRALVLRHHQDDTHPDRFYQMRNEMTVFGFGRHGIEKFLDSVPRSVSIGLVEATDFETLKQAARDYARSELPGLAVQSRERYEQFALTHPGNATRGEALFRDEARTKCLVCHKVNGAGGEVGPDLTSISGKFDRPHLIESLLEPSRQIVTGYRTSVVALRDGRLLTGIVREQGNGSLTLVDEKNQRHSIPHAEIEAQRESDQSLMPTGLWELVSPEEFTDLIAYMETLRGDSMQKMGAAVVGAITLPPGFEVKPVARGLTGATALETLPDGRVLICEQTGTLRVFKNGELLSEPMLSLSVDSLWERGLIGVTVDPGFPEIPYLYVCYVSGEPYPHHRVSRFTVQGDVADPASEQILLKGDDQRTLGGKVPAGHQGGAVHFGPDGKLYIGIGENTAETPAQSLETFQGKILRINSDGSIPQDNPLVDRTRGKYQAIWALGCRNPFTFAFDRRSGLMLINDVGGKFEEINVGRAGANYGWPIVDHGLPHRSEYDGPIHIYPQSSVNGGDFCDPESGWPAEFHGRYFFADFVQGWIKSIDPANPRESQLFIEGIRRPTDLRFSRDGSLYVLLRNAWVKDDKFQTESGSLLRVRFVRR